MTAITIRGKLDLPSRACKRLLVARFLRGTLTKTHQTAEDSSGQTCTEQNAKNYTKLDSPCRSVCMILVAGLVAFLVFSTLMFCGHVNMPSMREPARRHHIAI